MGIDLSPRPKLPRIKCAICQKPVDSVKAWKDHQYDVLVIVVTCHGDTDRMEIDFHLTNQKTLQSIQESEGVAFTGKRIEVTHDQRQND